MGLRIEWRSKAEGDDTLLAVEDDSDFVVEAWEANPLRLTDFLNDMEDFNAHGRDGRDSQSQYPDEWGALVLARSAEGDVLGIDPQLYWEGVAYWFRSRGDDPHPWRGHK
jgi:hypothetical protein